MSTSEIHMLREHLMEVTDALIGARAEVARLTSELQTATMERDVYLGQSRHLEALVNQLNSRQGYPNVRLPLPAAESRSGRALRKVARSLRNARRA